MKPNSKNHLHRNMAIVTTIFFIYITLHFAHAMWELYPGDTLQIFIKSLELAFSQPMLAFHFNELYWQPVNLLPMVLCLLLDVYLYAQWIRDHNRHAGREKGTARWGDYKQFAKEYSYTFRDNCRKRAEKRVKKIHGPLILFSPLIKLAFYCHYYIHDGVIGKWKEAWAEAKYEIEEKKRRA